MWAEGICEDLLTPHIEPYCDAWIKGWVTERDYLKIVSNHYFQCINWCLPDHEEPPTTVLKPYDPNFLDNDNGLTQEEVQAKHKKIKEVEEVSNNQ